MLELTQDQLKLTKTNKIKELKSILIEFGKIQKNNKIAGRFNQSLYDKLRYNCAKAANVELSLIIIGDREFRQYESAAMKIYKGLYNEGYQKLDLKNYLKWINLSPWIKETTFWTSTIIDKNNKEVKIYDNNNGNIDSIIKTLFHILYNKIKNKKRGHTHDDQKYIEIHKEHWKFMLEGMEVQQDLLESHYVKS